MEGLSMLRVLLTIALTIVGVGFVAGGEGDNDESGLFRNPKYPEIKPLDPGPENVFVVDREYSPEPGDEAVLADMGGYPMICKYRLDLIDLIGAASKRDAKALEKLAIDDKFKLIANGTRVRVNLCVPLEYRGMKYVAVSLTVLDGPFTGQTACTLSDWVVRLVEVRATPEQLANRRAQSDTAKRMENAAKDRPATLLRMAKSLEKAGKIKPALEDYREIVKIAPASPQAKTARERIAALGSN
jgi:hypothetical protein